MSKPLALIVDDEPDIRELLEITLARMDIDSHSAENICAARQALEKHAYDVCLADMRLPDGDGIELVKLINTDYPQTPVAMITAHGSMETAIEALKAGAFDFVSKPVDLSVLRQLVDTALREGAENLTLEVRVGNLDARRLYSRFGFAPVGIRKDYYVDGDALIMWVTDASGEEYRARLREIQEGLR